MIGLGDRNANIFVYTANRPPLDTYQQLDTFAHIKQGEISTIAEQTGNHWRKIFNVYAKLMFELSANGHNTWQELREQSLLQQGSKQALVFSPPCFDAKKLEQGHNNASVHIIMGKTYASSLNIAEQCLWLSPDFAINEKAQLIVCPYFDYRQLSNIKITQLITLIKAMRMKR
ncbi:hypothetical protein AAD001_06860 [Colwelliaceae bacterium 6471]